MQRCPYVEQSPLKPARPDQGPFAVAVHVRTRYSSALALKLGFEPAKRQQHLIWTSIQRQQRLSGRMLGLQDTDGTDGSVDKRACLMLPS